MGILHICELGENFEHVVKEFEFDELLKLDDDMGTKYCTMFSFNLRKNGCSRWVCVLINTGGGYSDNSYAVYNGKKYTGYEGFCKLIVVLEQEKIAKMLDTV